MEKIALIQETREVFIYIILTGLESYYKIGFNSQSLEKFKKRYHTYIGEFNYLKYTINIDNFKKAKKAGRNIEKAFKKQHEEDKAFSKYELYHKLNDDGKDMLGIYKRSLAAIINRQLFKVVRNYFVIFSMASFQ